MILSRQLSHTHDVHNLQHFSLEKITQIIKSEAKIERIIANKVLRGGRYLEK